MTIRLTGQHEGEELTQFAIRVPLRTARRLKAYCARHEVLIQRFVSDALAEALARGRRRARRQRSRG